MRLEATQRYRAKIEVQIDWRRYLVKFDDGTLGDFHISDDVRVGEFVIVSCSKSVKPHSANSCGLLTIHF